MFQHFLVTRFNLRNPDWKVTKSGGRILNNEWLEDRLELFQTYCLPSVKNQRNKNFNWEIFFDIETSSVFRNKINKLNWGDLNVTIHFIDGLSALQNSLIQVIKRKLKSENEFVITTRLDNDDIIHQDFIKVIQELFKPKPKTVIDLAAGYQVSIENDIGEIRNYYNKFNPFVSLIEGIESFETVYSRMHREWEGNENLIEKDDTKLWVELVHKKNQLNSENNNLDRALFFNAKEFGIDHTIISLKLDSKLILLRLHKVGDKILSPYKKVIKKILQR